MANIDNVQLPDGSSYNIVDNTSGFATQNYVDSAVSSVTKTTIGLGNVDNTSDLNKPISTATQAALNTLVSGKTNKTDIATVESGTTASRAYSVGELVYVSGTLYRVKTAIASGATFTVGTNIEATNVSTAMQTKVNNLSLTASSDKRTYTGNLDTSKFNVNAVVIANIENVGWISLVIPKITGYLTVNGNIGDIESAFYGYVSAGITPVGAVTVILTKYGASSTKITASSVIYY